MITIKTLNPINNHRVFCYQKCIQYFVLIETKIADDTLNFSKNY